MDPRPCTPAEAVARALAWVDKPGVYWLGAGNYHPHLIAGTMLDEPWTSAPNGAPASDCRFACCFCYKLPAHRGGFNKGTWASVSDDLNYNSAIEDSEHDRELFVPVDGPPAIGDILCYPTIWLSGHLEPWIGHGAIVVGVSRAANFDPIAPKFSLLDIVHCHGPPMVGPAITKSDGTVFDAHSMRWPKLEHRSRLLRLVP
jgi:hypothetical protein